MADYGDEEIDDHQDDFDDEDDVCCFITGRISKTSGNGYLLLTRILSYVRSSYLYRRSENIITGGRDAIRVP